MAAFCSITLASIYGVSNANAVGWYGGVQRITVTNEPKESYYEYGIQGECVPYESKIASSNLAGYYVANVCLYEAKSYYYGLIDGRLYVRLKNEDKMYFVNGPHFASISKVRASIESDNFTYGTTIIRDLPFKVKQMKTSADVRYYDAMSNIDILPINSQVVDSYISENGNWLVLNINNIGLVRINTKDLSAKWFAGGQARGSILAISDNGEYALASSTHSNQGPIVYSLTDCGQDSENYSNDWTYNDIDRHCAGYELSQEVNSALGSSWFAIERMPKFNKDGSQLRMFVFPNGDYQNGKAVEINTHGYNPKPNLDYLAIGDSYSSGEGDTETTSAGAKHYRQGTDIEGEAGLYPREECHISTRSYPYILARHMELGLPLANLNTKWNSVTCSGATAWDVKAQGQDEYKGQGSRLENYNASSMKTQALNEFIPGRQKQVAFVREYKPKAITLTMGGNDIGFAEKIRDCALSIATCSFATPEGSARLSKQIKDQYDNLKSLYRELLAASGYTSKVYVIGYPQFINGDANGYCGELNIIGLNGAERATIGKSVTYLNNVIKQASLSAGVKYVDIENSLLGHKLCDSGVKYVTGAAFIPPSETQESFHPNAKGQYAMAMTILGRLNNENLTTYSWCAVPGSGNMCPEASATKDMIPQVAEFEPSAIEKRTNFKDFLKDKIKKGVPNTVTLPPYSMAPGSSPRVTLRANGIVIAQPTVSQDGSVSVDVVIPGEVPAGSQVIDIEGETYSGEPVTNEDIVIVEGPNQNDVDEDGQNDTNDPCLFVTPSRVDEDTDGIDDACDPEIVSMPATPSPTPAPTPSPTSTPSPSPTSTPTPTSTPSPSPTPGTNNSGLSGLLKNIKKAIIAVVKIVVKIVIKIASLFGTMQVAVTSASAHV